MVPTAFQEVQRLDRELARLSRGEGPIRLRLGDAVEALGKASGHQELGFPTMAQYARERCERSASFVSESRAMARRLEELPATRAALAAGDIEWSMADLLSRRATPLDEKKLLEAAGYCTVGQMKSMLPPKEGEPDEDDVIVMKTLSITLPVADAWALEHAKMLVGAMEGIRSDEAVAYALLGEAHTTLVELPDFDLDDATMRAQAAAAAAHRARTAGCQLEAEKTAEEGLHLHVEKPPATPEPALPTSPRELDCYIIKLCRELSTRDVEMGLLARKLFEANGWRRLGFASEIQYTRERLGCSVASLRARMTLSRRAVRLPAVTAAMSRGEIGFEAASLVARVATPKTVDSWLARAKKRTLLNLREEVELIEMLARVNGDPKVLSFGPPDAELVEAGKNIERSVLSGKVFQNSGGQAAAPAAKDSEDEAKSEVGLRIRPGAGQVTVRLRVTEETYWTWKALERAFKRSRVPGGFVEFLCWNFWHTWHHLTKAYNGSHGAVLVRDVYRCTNPVCGRRWCEDHHLRFLSQGGGDELENRTLVCHWCHNYGIHEMRLRATPPASNLTWLIGRTPVLRVEGRDKYQCE